MLASVTAVLALSGAAGLVAAGATAPYDFYLSQLGADGEPTAGRFHVGLLLTAAAIGAFAAALAATRPLWSRSAGPGQRLITPALGTLAASAVLFAATAQEPCSQGCPLPPYGVPTPADWIHAVFAVTAFAAGVVAILGVSLAAADRQLRVVSWITCAVVAVTSLAGALVALVEVDGPIGGTCERAAGVAGLAWLLAGSLRLLRLVRRTPVPPAAPGGPTDPISRTRAAAGAPPRP